MAAMVDQWQERVEEVRRELAAVDTEIAQLDDQKLILANDSEKFAVAAKKEKNGLAAKLQALQQRAVAVDEQKARAEKLLAEAKDEDAAASAEYARLASVVKQILRDEKTMAEGEDYAATLAKESHAWAAEEHQLRARLAQLEKEVLAQRKTLKADVDVEYAARKKADQAVKAARMGRTAEEGTEPMTLQMVFERESGLFQRPANGPTFAGKKTARDEIAASA